jgi:tRNA (guanine37-N1)-methyltransferase
MTNDRQNPFCASLITLYPEMFPGPLGVSLAGRAHDKGLWQLETVDLRQFGVGKHRQVDDTPAGGGAGMVLRADVLAAAIDHVSEEEDPRPRFLMSPRGPLLNQARVRELAKGPGALIVCGRFEGVDERVIEARQLKEISIGDYILSGGEPAAMTMLDAIIRLLPGVMGNSLSGQHESHDSGLLEHPHYTRPQIFEGREIPQVLTSGNHQKIDQWRQQSSKEITREIRPDLIRD